MYCGKHNALPIYSISFLAAIIDRDIENETKKKKRKENSKIRDRLRSPSFFFYLARRNTQADAKAATLSRSRGVLKQGWKLTPQRPVDTLLIYDLLRDSYGSLPTLFNWKTGLENLGYIAHASFLLLLFHLDSLLHFTFLPSSYKFLIEFKFASLYSWRDVTFWNKEIVSRVFLLPYKYYLKITFIYLLSYIYTNINIITFLLIDW